MTTPDQTRIATQRRRWMVWRKFMMLIAGSVATWPLCSYAQQPQSAPAKRIGILAPYPCELVEPWWSTHLAELGWSKGQVAVECVSMLGHGLDQLRDLARDLGSRHPDVLFASQASFVRALMEETTDIPIVMGWTPDPVTSGMVTNPARPEGNVTGGAGFDFDRLPKQIELLKEIVPHLKRLAIVTGARDPQDIRNIEERAAEQEHGVALQMFRAAVANDYDAIFARIAKEHYDAAYIQADLLSNQPGNGARICELALRYVIPTVSGGIEWARDGLLLSYGQNYNQSAALALGYVDKVLRGAKPSGLPVEQAIKVDLVVNLKTAKALGLTVPPSLLARADEVIK
jgi:putative tryptophan/tyrosine transport system substrate-binding protein